MAEAETNNFAPQSLGTWMWGGDTYVLLIDETLAFLTSHNVTELYLNCSPAMPKNKLRAFVKACSEAGISVSLIASETKWATPEGLQSFDSFVKWFEEYQLSCGDPDEKLAGMHSDVEPHQLTNWQSEQRVCVEGYMAFMQKARADCDRLGVNFDADIPTWFDQFTVEYMGEQMSLMEAVVRMCDTTVQMSYRDNANAILASAKNGLAIAKRLNKRMVLSVETGKIYETPNITFYHLGTKVLYRELNSLAELVNTVTAPDELGYAIHYYYSWKGLPEEGYPKGSDYPY